MEDDFIIKNQSIAAAFRFSSIAAIVVGLGVCALRPSPRLAELPGMHNRIGAWLDYHDVARTGVGFGLAGLFVLFLLPPHWRTRGAVGLALFGIGLELAQLLIPTRSCDRQDMVATCAGVAGAWAIVRALRIVKTRPSK